MLLEVEPTDTILALKERALEKWPTGGRARFVVAPCVWRAQCDRQSHPQYFSLLLFSSSAGVDTPVAGQLRIIFQGRFMADSAGLKGTHERFGNTPLDRRGWRGAIVVARSCRRAAVPCQQSRASAPPSPFQLTAFVCLPALLRMQGGRWGDDSDAHHCQVHCRPTRECAVACDPHDHAPSARPPTRSPPRPL